MRRYLSFLVALLFAAIAIHATAAEPDSGEASLPQTRTEHPIEGWTVRMDDRLFATPHEALGQRAVALLTATLADITAMVAPDRLEKLRAIPIVVDLNHGKLDNMQYHPSVGWLEANGYSRELAKCVHIPVAAQFVRPAHHHAQPWCLLHELAHGYHDQVLGFDEPRIKEIWTHYCSSGHGQSVLHITGRHIPHYALTNQKEFFAEMSEAYFGMNDFSPFNRAELKEQEPEIFALLKEVWGPTP